MSTHNAEEILRSLRALMAPGQIVELRALEVSTPKYPRPHTVSGYFDDLETLAQQAMLVSKAKGIYVTMNPLKPALLSRAMNRLRALSDRDSLTGDADVLSRRWLMIDADPIRPSGISSSDEEHTWAAEKVTAIGRILSEHGWPAAAVADSGNGGHLLYRVDLPNDDVSRDLLKRVLESLAFRFDDAQISIDQKVFNAARIWKLYGTLACKGDNTPQRPHRLSAVLDVPEILTIVTREQLAQVASWKPATPVPAARQANFTGESFDVESWIATHGLDVLEPKPWQGGQKWLFRICPWNPDHRDRSAYLVQFASGAIAAGCHHNGCTGNDWHGLREMIDPKPIRPVTPPPVPVPSARSHTGESPSPLDGSPHPAPRTPVDELSKELIGLEDIGERIIWVSSKEEKAMVQSAGYRSCVAVPEIPELGVNYRRHLTYLATLESLLTPESRHTFLLPNTLAGRALMNELARRIGPERCATVAWPSECEMVEHIVTIYGIEVLQETIEGATPIPIRGIVELSSLRQTLHDWHQGKNGMPKGVSPGWESLAQIYRARPGELSLIHGMPHAGKSTLLSAMAVNIMERERWGMTIFSPEQAPPARYAVTLLQQWTGWPFNEGPRERMSLQTMDDALDDLSGMVSLLWPEDESPTLDILLELARKEVFRRGIKGLVIDPWGEIMHQYRPGQREDQYIAESLTKIRLFARIHEVHVWLVVHPTKLQKNDKNKYPVPTPYDMAGGAAWFNKADNILAVHRELGGPDERVVQLHTQKIRFPENGQAGKLVELRYHATNNRFSEVPGSLNRGPVQ